MIPLGSDEDQTATPDRTGAGYRAEGAVVRSSIRSIGLEAVTFGDLLALELLVELEAAIAREIDVAGRSLRAGGASYGQLGAATGISRQAARKRFDSSPDVARCNCGAWRVVDRSCDYCSSRSEPPS